MNRLVIFLAVAVLATFSPVPRPALADSLYVAAPVALAPGHPLRLVNDHRASQIGDLVAVQFNFSVSSSSTKTAAQKKDYNAALVGGTGLFNLPLLHVPGGITGTTGADSSKAKSDASSFNTVMMATVSDVLPSGALVVDGDQKVVIDGQSRVLHVRGTVRQEDIDSSDTVLSSRIANVDAHFDGDNKSDHHGLLQKVIDVLF